jgi:hypothetical protein
MDLEASPVFRVICHLEELSHSLERDNIANPFWVVSDRDTSE